MVRAVDRTMRFTPELTSAQEDINRVNAGPGTVYDWVRQRLAELQALLPTIQTAGDGWADSSAATTDLAETIRVAADQAAEYWSGEPAAVELQRALADLYGTVIRMSTAASFMGRFTHNVAQHGRESAARFDDQAGQVKRAEHLFPGIQAKTAAGGQPAANASDRAAWQVFDGLNRAWDDEAQYTAPHELHITYPFPENIVRDPTHDRDANQQSSYDNGPDQSPHWAPGSAGGSSRNMHDSPGPFQSSSHPPPSPRLSRPNAGVEAPGSPYDPSTVLAGGDDVSSALGGSAGGLRSPGVSGGPSVVVDPGSVGSSGHFDGPSGRGNGRSGVGSISIGGPGTGGGGAAIAPPVGAGSTRENGQERERRYWLAEDEAWFVEQPMPAVLMGEHRPLRPDDEDEHDGDDDW
ncbi:MAG TPA: hypothetical protein VLJ59_17755 [Mycobacteriales bacterium]|nr:hypothetical protein [Mycobacteriales bacterium]